MAPRLQQPSELSSLHTMRARGGVSPAGRQADRPPDGLIAAGAPALQQSDRQADRQEEESRTVGKRREEGGSVTRTVVKLWLKF